MITVDFGTGAPDPFAAPIPTPDGPARPITWWAVALSTVANTTVAIGLWTGRADPTRAVATVAAMTLCSLLLIAAEQLHGRYTR